MRTDRKRSAWLGGVLLAGGLAAGAVGVRQRATTHAPPADLEGPAQRLREGIDSALVTMAAALEPEAKKAASIPALGAARKMGADRATYQDLLDNEEWAAPYRTRFAVTAIVLPAGATAALGRPPGDLVGNPVVTRAREVGSAVSGLFSSPREAFFAAAAPVAASAPSPGGPPLVVLLAQPVDQAALELLAGRTGDVVGLSDGTRLLAATGPEASRGLVASLVGPAGPGPVLIDGGRVGLAWRLGEHLWILGASPPGNVLAAAPSPTGLGLLIAGVALALLGVLALAVRGSGGGPGATTTGPGVGALPASDPRLPAPVLTELMPAPAGFTQRVHAATSAGVGLSTGAVGPGFAPDTQPFALSSTQPPPAPAAGELREMGRYRLIERIGEGGMAEIFFAAAYGAENFVRHFVLKRMHPHLARHREVVNQFIDEARLQAGLVHSNIVPVFDFGKAGEEYYLALEYIHGRDLGQIVQQHITKLGRPLDVATSFFVLHEVLDALAFAHSQTSKDGSPMDIVHRDVAPGNVLVSYRGEVKLTDFGIAKSERRVSKTEVGMVKGNASFMSPEQARGESVDHRSDIFSAGLVLYYCLTGNFLYSGENSLNQLLRAAVGPVTLQFAAIGELPGEAAEVLRRALASTPGDRYEGAADFERAVTKLMGTRSDVERLMETLFPATERRDLRQDRLKADQRA